MPIIEAKVQYNDWTGQVAADGGHNKSFDMLLREKGFTSQCEYVVSISLWVGENFDGKPESAEIVALVADGVGYGNIDEQLQANQLRLREVHVPQSLEEFFGAFKRFKLVLTMPHADLYGREYEVTNPPEQE